MFLSPLISVAVKKAADSLTEQFCRMRGLDKNRRKLHRQLLAIQQKIADAEEHGEEWWLKELEAAAHAAVDVLDEFQYEALRRNAISQQPGSSATAMKSFFTHENPAVFRYNMSNKLEKVLEKIDEIVIEMNKFNFTSRDPAPSIERETHSLVMESEVIGRDSEKEKIMHEVIDPRRKRDNISILAIVGMGGLGKTTLAQLVYNDERVKTHFELLLWVCASSNFDTINISKSILEVATNGGEVSTSNKEVLQRRLRGILDTKRYLLVLDDVWNEEKDKWDELRTILFSGASSGSVIIVTTRSKRVASIMGTLPSHDLASLTNEDSWRLFEKRAFGAKLKEPTEELRTIGKTIACKCVGLPLALKAVGGMMRTKTEVRDWRAISESNILDVLQSTGNVLPVLKLSYDNLPSHTKQCFAFCAIFPKDYVIEREILIQLWMANDFIPTPGSIENLEEKGRHIFYELYWGSFFQDIKEEETDYGSIIKCKMHDLMHDLATQIAGNKCSNKLELNNPRIIPEEVHHLSILNEKLPEINNVLKQFPTIHTYLVRYTYYYLTQEEKSSSLLKSCSLRALQFRSRCPPKELGYMKHIRYLNLSWGKFETLPETISTLYNLQTLILSHSDVQTLPTEMRNMVNLRHLFLDGCKHLKYMPIGLGQLKYLQTLTKYVVDSGRGSCIKELKNLNLCGHMSLCGLDNVKDREDAETVNLAAKTNLSSLELRWGPTDKKGATRNDEAVLEALAPPNKIKYFAIDGYSGSNFPKWMKETLIVTNLKKLRLKKCNNCAELPLLWKLPLLEGLYLEELESLLHIVVRTGEQVEGSKSKLIFPALKIFQVSSLSNLESWHVELYELISFPKLDKLTIYDCPKLLSLPIHVPILRKLTISKGDYFFSYEPTKLLTLECWKYFVSLETLQIFYSDALVFWPVEEFRSLKCLKVLRIGGCRNFNGSLQALSLPTSCVEGSIPQLESLYIFNCPELVEVHVCSKSLRNLSIIECPKISQEGLAELTNLTELRRLELSSCTKWRAWPEDMEHLPSLEDLEIENCPGIESFPEGVQRRLPSLQFLQIADCPALERRCIRGGDYWHLVSLIPNKYIEIEEPAISGRRILSIGLWEKRRWLSSLFR